MDYKIDDSISPSTNECIDKINDNIDENKLTQLIDLFKAEPNKYIDKLIDIYLEDPKNQIDVRSILNIVTFLIIDPEEYFQIDQYILKLVLLILTNFKDDFLEWIINDDKYQLFIDEIINNIFLQIYEVYISTSKKDNIVVMIMIIQYLIEILEIEEMPILDYIFSSWDPDMDLEITFSILQLSLSLREKEIPSFSLSFYKLTLVQIVEILLDQQKNVNYGEDDSLEMILSTLIILTELNENFDVFQHNYLKTNLYEIMNINTDLIWKFMTFIAIDFPEYFNCYDIKVEKIINIIKNNINNDNIEYGIAFLNVIYNFHGCIYLMENAKYFIYLYENYYCNFTSKIKQQMAIHMLTIFCSYPDMVCEMEESARSDFLSIICNLLEIEKIQKDQVIIIINSLKDHDINDVEIKDIEYILND